MKVWLEKYFGFTQKEIRGLCVLVIIAGVLIAYPVLHRWSTADEKGLITAKDEKQIQDFLSAIEHRKESSAVSYSSKALKPTAEYFVFDPNKLSISDGIRLGLSERQVQTIHNYIAKGGTFYKKEDFKKIYTIDADDYQRLSPYISIPEISRKPSYPKKVSTSSSSITNERKSISAKLSIELNNTDSIDLQSLRGIGPVFASRIIRFRDNLGGFHDVSQLLSVYGMDEERFQGIKDHVYVDTTLIDKININHADYDRLRKHSFISAKQANVIVQYRKQHGDYATINDLLKIAILDEEFLIKIAPYLIFSND